MKDEVFEMGETNPIVEYLEIAKRAGILPYVDVNKERAKLVIGLIEIFFEDKTEGGFDYTGWAMDTSGYDLKDD